MAKKNYQWDSIGAVLMVKDEEKNIGKSLDSIQKAGIKWVGVYDTGSTDSTISISKKWGNLRREVGNLRSQLEIVERKWENFGVTRTKALKWAETVAPVNIKWFLMLDANDEIQMTVGRSLPTVLNADAYKVKQYLYRSKDLRAQWRNFIFRRGIGWECTGVVYENYRLPHRLEPNFGIIDCFTLYQNRDDDDNKTNDRAQSWDLKYFAKITESHEALQTGDPEEISEKYRQMYYHAQSNLMVGNIDEAYALYTQRTKWVGNIAHCHGSMYSCGSIAEDRKDWKCALNWYHSALELGERWTKKLCVASLLGLGRIYIKLKMYHLAYTHLKASLGEKEPSGTSDFVTWSQYDYEWRRYLLLGRAASFFLNDPVKRKEGISALCKALLSSSLPEVYKKEVQSLLNKKFYGKLFHLCSPYNGGSNLYEKILRANGYSTALFNQLMWKHTTRWEKLEEKISRSQDNEVWIICHRHPASWSMSMKKHSYNLKFDDPNQEIHFTGEPIQNEPERFWSNLGECYTERYINYIKLTKQFPRKIKWLSYEQVILRGAPYINKKLSIRLDSTVTEKVFDEPAKDHGKSVQNIVEARNKLVRCKKAGWNIYTPTIKQKLERVHETCCQYSE